MPVIFANFGTFSPVSFLANAVILPIVPYSMLGTAFVGVAGMISSTLGSLLAFPAYAAIRPIILGTEYMAGLSRGAMIQSGFGWIATVIWYSVLGLVFLFIDKNRQMAVAKNEEDDLRGHLESD